MLCPLCRKEYTVEDIGKHVDSCLSLVNVTPQESSTSKRPFINEEIVETNVSKKYKASPVKNMSNINQHKITTNKEYVPLAEKMRPVCLDDYVGQEQVIGSNTVLQQLLTKGCIPSMVFWGPPGCGKVTIINCYSVFNF